MGNTRSIKSKKKLGSYPYLTVIFSISLALFSLGIFGIISIFGLNLSKKIKSSFEIQVYLNSTTTPSQASHIEKIILSKPYTGSAKLITKEEVLKKYVFKSKDNPESLLGYNPLKDYISLKVNEEYSEQEKLGAIKSDLEKINGVFEAEYMEDFISIINENITKIGLILLGVCFFLTLVIFILINNTIKLALFSQRFLIRSMQLVGATDWFIQRPFLSRALWQGAFSGVIASLSVYGIYTYALTKMDELQLLFNNELFLALSGFLILIGALIGFVSSYWAVNKYLKLSLNELY